MATRRPTRTRPQSLSDWPSYWFVALERAIEEGDQEAAAQARASLQRLGYSVIATAPPLAPVRASDLLAQGLSQADLRALARLLPPHTALDGQACWPDPERLAEALELLTLEQAGGAR